MTRIPAMMTLVAGRIASGKSTIARQLAEGLGATLLVADQIRESAVADAAVYAELLRRAGEELAAGRSVVLDAAFPKRALRDEARARAARHGARFRLVECRAGDAAVRARLAARAAAAGIGLERWVALREAFDAAFEAPSELPPAERLQLDTSGPAAESAATAVAWLAPARGG